MDKYIDLQICEFIQNKNLPNLNDKELALFLQSRIEKFINSQGIVSREDFEALIDRHEKLNAEFNILKAKLEKKNIKLK